MKNLKRHIGKLLAVIPIALALLIVVTWVASKEEPQQKEIPESVRTMRVIKVPRTDLIPRAIGFGVAEPERIWRAMAEVKGRVVEVHPDTAAECGFGNGEWVWIENWMGKGKERGREARCGWRDGGGHRPRYQERPHGAGRRDVRRELGNRARG